ncbi:MAG: hypothetical protein IPJ74_13875 [Saprospiraceae bacterium]|nr:hypothetical protein [Saprospiraceae bacterium]
MNHNSLYKLMSRRQFTQNMAATALITALHPSFAFCNLMPKMAKPTARIKSLHLLTAAPLAEMKHFYHNLLELPILNEKPKELSVRAGETDITFLKIDASQQPFYHFAFNIPENKIIAARIWQKERSPLFATPSHMIDPDYPDDIRHFRNWNAHSVFFWDPAGNILEYIARHDLKNKASGDFSGKDILCASEIGFVVDDATNTAELVKTAFGLVQYRNGDENFRAIGDEMGLLLIFKRGRQIGDQTGGKPKFCNEIFKTGVEIQGAPDKKLSIPGYPYQISAM